MSASRPSEIPDGTPTIGRGRYFVLNRLGEGGLAGVYRAWDTRLRVWRAVKILFPQYANDERVRRRFGGEAHAMARLVHDNLVRVYDVDEEGALPFLVMELVDGGTLHDWILRYGPMSPRQASMVVQQVAAGVGAAHDASVIHRDVKPQNVLIAKTGQCKLTDFGIARQLDLDQTLDGVPLGTRGYMAPEQYRDASSVDSRADIFGLGATLWTLLTGRLPPDVFDVQRRPELLEMVPKPLRPVIRVCCTMQPADRLKRADSLERALATASAQLPPDPPDATRLTADLLEAPDIGEWIDFPEIRPILERPGESLPPAPQPQYQTPVPAAAASAPPSDVGEAPGSRSAGWSDPPPPDSGTPIIPYTMPNVTGRATPLRERARREDSVPDYIDAADLARATPVRGVTPAGLNVQLKAREVIAGHTEPPHVPTAGHSMTPPPFPGNTPTATPAPPSHRGIVPSHTPAPPRLAPTPSPLPRHSTPPPHIRTREQRANTIAVVAAGIASLVALIGVFGLLMTSSGLTKARNSVDESRQKVHAALRDLGPLISGLQAQNKDQLAESFLSYTERRDAGEPARINAALRLLDHFEQAVPASVSMNDSMSAVTTKARRLKAIRQHYEADLSAWHARSSRFPGSLVVKLGLTTPPPEAEAWR